MEARVIKIISNQQIVLNVGAKQGVEIGDVFQLVDRDGEEVYDPETDEFLGTLDFTKAEVKVEKVYPKMCICVNNQTLSLIANKNSSFTISSTLNVNLNQVSGGFNKNELSPIQIGDIAYSK